jgi:class 3 adenylate cyclase
VIAGHLLFSPIGRRTVSDQRRNFVGRKRELAEMRTALDETMAGRGGLLLLSGEPGIGKTSLANLVATEAAARGAVVAWGRCWEGGGAPAFWPWIAVIRAYLSNRDLHPLDTIPAHARDYVAKLLPELRGSEAAPAEAEQFAAASGLSSGEPADQRFRLFDAIATLLASLARHRPLVIVLDDCHLADPASLLLLRFVARDIHRLALLVIVTYRETEVSRDPELAQLMAELGREGSRISLRGLTVADVAEFVATAAGTRPYQRMIERLMSATEGNPFFVSEIVRLLVAERQLGRDDAEDFGSFRIPDSIRVAIRRRIALISEPARNALTVASVVGHEFDLPMIRDACGLPIEQLIAALDEAEDCGLVSEVADNIGRYRFDHALISETLYDDLSRRDARELHLRIAKTIETLHGSALEPQFAKLAYHYHAALPLSPLDKTIACAQRGAQNARAMLAYEDAARLFEMAIQALEMSQPVDEKLRCELLLSMGEALHAAGLFNRTRSAFELAAKSAKIIGSAEQLARAAIGFGLPPSTPGTIDHKLISLLEEAAKSLSENDSALLAMVLARMASEFFWAHDPRRTALAGQALEIARRVNDPFALLYVLFTRHTALWEPENLPERLAATGEIIRLAEDTGNQTWALRARYMRIADLLELGDIPAVDSEIEQYSKLAAELRQHLGYEHLARATRALMDGRFEEAERLANQTLEVAGRLERRTRPFRQAVNSQMLILRREQGRLRELEPFFRSNRARLRRSPLALCAMAFCYSELGQRNEARSIFEELAAGDFESLPRDMGWYSMLVLLSEVCCAIGDSARAAVLYRLLAPHEARNAILDIHVCYGSVAHYLGTLSVAMGELDRAQTHFESALRFNLKMGARPWVARTRYHYAAMLVARGNPGDREKANQLAELAQASAESIGMKALAERVRELRGLDLRAGAAPDGTVTILFSDIENSTPITEQLGDLRAHELLQAHNAIIREQIAAHQGFEVKSMGDGFMIAFSSARRALLCAIAIERAFAAYTAEHPDTPLRVSIGIHTGEAIKETGDFYGKAVIIASRIGAKARGGEILVSSTLKDLTENIGDVQFDAGRDVQLKGLTGVHRLYAVNWQNDRP